MYARTHAETIRSGASQAISTNRWPYPEGQLGLGGASQQRGTCPRTAPRPCSMLRGPLPPMGIDHVSRQIRLSQASLQAHDSSRGATPRSARVEQLTRLTSHVAHVLELVHCVATSCCAGGRGPPTPSRL